MPPSDMPANVATSPIVIYVGIGLAVAGMILAFFPKILPPFAKFLDQRAQIKRSGVDRRFNDMDQQLEFFQAQLTEEREGRAKDRRESEGARAQDRRELETEIGKLRGELHDYRMRAGAHVGWDYARVVAAAKRGETIPDPPPLFPPSDPDERIPPDMEEEQTP